LRVMRDGRPVTVEVHDDGRSLSISPTTAAPPTLTRRAAEGSASRSLRWAILQRPRLMRQPHAKAQASFGRRSARTTTCWGVDERVRPQLKLAVGLWLEADRRATWLVVQVDRSRAGWPIQRAVRRRVDLDAGSGRASLRGAMTRLMRARSLDCGRGMAARRLGFAYGRTARRAASNHHGGTYVATDRTVGTASAVVGVARLRFFAGLPAWMCLVELWSLALSGAFSL
jgi:hypothetical protein